MTETIAMKYLKEFIKSITDERYEPYEMMEEYARDQYNYHRQEDSTNLTIRDENGRFLSFEEYYTKNGEFLNTVFWDFFTEDVMNNFDFGTIKPFEIYYDPKTNTYSILQKSKSYEGRIIEFKKWLKTLSPELKQKYEQEIIVENI